MPLRSLAHLRRWGSAARPPTAATPATLRGVRDLLAPGSIREHPRRGAVTLLFHLAVQRDCCSISGSTTQPA